MIDLTKVSELKFDKVIEKIEDINGLVIYEAWKNLIASGVPPLTLLNCGGKDLVDYKLYGDSRQGTLLPIEYQQLDYIESTGTQYIEIDYIASGNTVSKGTYQLTNVDVASMLFGSRTNASTSGYALNWSSVKPSTYINTYGSGGNAGSTNKTIDTLKHTFEKRYGDLYVDGELISKRGKFAFDTPSNMIVFGCATAGQISHKCQAKIYSLQFYDENTLKIDLVPCYKKEDDVAGMYDLVNNVFYTNQGEGEFIKGEGLARPDAPIEVESVGEKTKNLFDESLLLENSAVKKTNNGYAVGTYPANFTSSSALVKHLKSVLKPDTTYTLTRLVSNYSSSYTGAVMIRNSSGTMVDTLYGNGIRSKTFSLTQDEIDSISNVYVYGRAENPTIFEFIQLEEGDSFTGYEPYGYKIPVKVSSNLENITFKEGYYIDANNNEVLSNSYKCTNEYISVLPNTEYTLIFDGAFKVSIYATIPFYDKDKNFITRLAGLGDFMTLPKIITFTTPENCYFIRFSMPVQKYTIEFSNTTNIYLNEPLRKGGEYADYIDFKNQKVIRKIDNYIFDGTEEWVKHTTTDDGYGVFRIDDVLDILLKVPTSTTFMSHFSLTDISSTADFTLGLYRPSRNSGGISSSRIYISAEQTTVEEFKEWVTNNKPSIVYPLAKEKPETINLPNIPTIKGTTILSIDTTIQPSNLEVVYKGK